ncbi:MAG: 50S ribosomal protein L13 [Candidatus Saccharimonadales bacterium]|nr:50S ribosomal protein L13 [Candidatus Saccharimonadales bacterium]
MKTKTTSQKASEVTRQWHLVDASAAPMGRVATKVAQLLTGKHKPSYTPHIDGGDYVVVINTDNILVTGNKATQKKYYRHSQHPGSLKETTLEKRLTANSTKVFSDAVAGMLPKNKLRTERQKRLKVYPGAEHQHASQNPKVLEIK